MSASIKQRVLQLAARIDALSLRERAMVFGATIAVLAFAGNTVVLAPQDAKQAALRTQIDQQQTAMAAIDAEITARVEGSRIDPDAQSRTRLNTMQQEMGQLVEGILRANGRLKLVSMRTLPAEPLAAPGATTAPAAAAGAAPVAGGDVPLLYRHGVEVTVRGNYLDMVDYMSTLDAMPTRMFWGRAQLDVEAYPTARLTLTLHTLSLDRQWMKL
jgi:MSHA biogenesis protein MshJ